MRGPADPGGEPRPVPPCVPRTYSERFGHRMRGGTYGLTPARSARAQRATAQWQAQVSLSNTALARAVTKRARARVHRRISPDESSVRRWSDALYHGSSSSGSWYSSCSWRSEAARWPSSTNTDETAPFSAGQRTRKGRLLRVSGCQRGARYCRASPARSIAKGCRARRPRRTGRSSARRTGRSPAR